MKQAHGSTEEPLTIMRNQMNQIEHELEGSAEEPLALISEGINRIEQEVEQAWGRKAEATWFTATFSLILVIICPLVLLFNWATLEHFGGSMTDALSTLTDDGPVSFLIQYGPTPSKKATLLYAGWLVFQGLVYQFLPGPISTGQMTPAGNLLKYKTNGLRAWIITHALFLGAGATGVLDLAIIAKNFSGLLVAELVYGFLLALFAQVKAHVAPTHPNDRKFSGSFIFDYFVGIEFNPRFGELWDFKLFHNGRPGIIAWTLISLSYNAYQYQRIGYVSNSMWMVNLFHFIYVVDFFYNESWYLRTIDMAHDHFGYYLGFGSVAIVPNLYTIQAQYLARYPVDLPLGQVLGILAIGLGGYVIFRGANYQKDIVRSTGGKCDIWGKPAKFIRAPYKCSDGQMHESLLLTSGWWGVSRHANYLGDIMQAFAMGASCGSEHIIPWTYTLIIAAIFANRIPRDEARCSGKYGKTWQRYCDQVPWRICPGIL